MSFMRSTDMSKDLNYIQQRALMAKYLQDQKILIVDTSSLSRTRMAKLLVELGANLVNIKALSSFNQAQKAMESEIAKIVFSEYCLGKSSGFDLLRHYRNKYKATEDSLFFLVTSTPSQSIVARAAEEDVDSFLLRPYTLDSLAEMLTASYISKFYPSEYKETITEGKKLLQLGNIDLASKQFKKAKTLEGESTLAYYYSGHLETLNNLQDKAEENFREGLTINKIHYKCLQGMFDLLYKQDRFFEAYRIIRTMVEFFPTNPNRLATAIRLAIITENINDIEQYYQSYKEVDPVSDDLANSLCAGLIICGKVQLGKGKIKNALSMFVKVVEIADRKLKFIRYIIEYLVMFGKPQEVEKFFRVFKLSDQETQDYKISYFLNNLKNISSEQIIERAKIMLLDEVYSVGIYYALVDNLLANKKIKEAQLYLNDASIRWPEKMSVFNSLIDHMNSISSIPSKDANG